MTITLMTSTVLTTVTGPDGPLVTTVCREVDVVCWDVEASSPGPESGGGVFDEPPAVVVAEFGDGCVCPFELDEEPPS
jgi:hypothetical protein